MIQIDYQDRRPIYEQIVEKMQGLILKGILEPDEQLPSVRKLAVELSINPNTIQKAYNQLELLGIVYSVKGRGSYVSPNLKKVEMQIAKFEKELKELSQSGIEKGISREDVINQVKKCYEEVENDKG